jgi:hypothetical protein
MGAPSAVFCRDRSWREGRQSGQYAWVVGPRPAAFVCGVLGLLACGDGSEGVGEPEDDCQTIALDYGAPSDASADEALAEFLPDRGGERQVPTEGWVAGRVDGAFVTERNGGWVAFVQSGHVAEVSNCANRFAAAQGRDTTDPATEATAGP